MSYRIKTDLHTHSVATGHAYSTIVEMVTEAAARGIEMIANTDHGPAMPDTHHQMYFWNMQVIPRSYRGVYILRGIEANIIDWDGRLDLEERYLKRLDWVIASLHTLCIDETDPETVSRMWLKIADNPYVDVIGHCGDERFRFDYERVIPVLAEKGKLIEINNHSFAVRPGSDRNCRRILEICKEVSAKIVVDTDAHFCTEVGDFPAAEKLLEEVAYPEELILNLNAARVKEHLRTKKGIDLDK